MEIDVARHEYAKLTAKARKYGKNFRARLKVENPLLLKEYDRAASVLRRCRRGQKPELSRAAGLSRYFIKPGQRMTLDDYNQLFAQQNEKCRICAKDAEIGPLGIKILSVDHCHASGLVRALLCKNCNFGIGNLQDRLDRINGLLQYVINCKSVEQGTKAAPIPELYYQHIMDQNATAMSRLVEAVGGYQCCSCGDRQNLRVDHSKKTRQIRGILCHGCNVAFGHFYEDIALLEKAKGYILWCKAQF